MTVSGLTMTSAVCQLFQTRAPHPQQAIRRRQPEPRRPDSVKHLQLVPSRQDLELERSARTRPSA